MRTYYDIDLTGRRITKRELHGEEIVRAGRYWIARTLLDDAAPYLGKGNFEAQEMLHKKYGRKVTIALCGPVGEYQGLLAGIAFSDKDGRPARLSARGGVGAVMGSKRVKAVVVDLDKIPPFTDAKKVNVAIKDYAKMLLADSMVTNFYQKIGTMG